MVGSIKKEVVSNMTVAEQVQYGYGVYTPGTVQEIEHSKSRAMQRAVLGMYLVHVVQDCGSLMSRRMQWSHRGLIFVIGSWFGQLPCLYNHFPEYLKLEKQISGSYSKS